MELRSITIEQAESAGYPSICRQAGADFFHQLPWLRFLSSLTSEGYLYLSGIFEKDLLIGLLPLWLDQKLGFRAPNRAPATPYLGPVIPLPRHPAKSAAKIEQLVELLTPTLKRYPLGRIFLPPEMSDVRPFISHGFAVLPRYTNRIRFSPEQEMDFLPQLRNKIRRGEKAGLTVETSEDAETLIELNQATYLRQGKKSIFSESFLRQLVKQMTAEGWGKLWLCRNPQGKALACRLLLQDELWGYDLLAAGADREEDDEMASAGPYLVAKILASLRGEVSGYDFCGANIPSIAAFKASFGGKLEPFFCINWGKFWARALSPVLARLS
jgi:hypothetical protein